MFNMPARWLRSEWYSPLKQSEDVEVRKIPPPPSHAAASTSSSSSFGRYCLALLALASSFMLGSYWQRLHATRHDQQSQANIALPLEPRIFRYNPIYGTAPSPESNAAWQAMFPDQGGFFKHPRIAPERSAFAVFHQLHCLDAIRQGYWALAEHATSESPSPAKPMDLEKDLPFMISPPHIRHCIDLIRNSLTCRPDTTVEVKDKVLRGVTGFGTEHQCVKWDGLLDWVSTWEDYDPDPRDDPSGEDSTEPIHAGHSHQSSAT